MCTVMFLGLNETKGSPEGLGRSPRIKVRIVIIILGLYMG